MYNWNKVKIVKQEDEFGCMIACLATIVNQTYAEVKFFFKEDVSKFGTNYKHAIDFLSDYGFEVIYKRNYCSYINGRAFDNMKAPFADIHIVSAFQFVDIKETAHAFIMDKKGILYNPSNQEKTKWSEIYDTSYVLGIYRR